MAIPEAIHRPVFGDEAWVYHPGSSPTVSAECLARSIGLNLPFSLRDLRRARGFVANLDLKQHLREHNDAHGGAVPAFENFCDVSSKSQEVSNPKHFRTRFFARVRAQTRFHRPRVSIALVMMCIMTNKSNSEREQCAQGIALEVRARGPCARARKRTSSAMDDVRSRSTNPFARTHSLTRSRPRATSSRSSAPSSSRLATRARSSSVRCVRARAARALTGRELCEGSDSRA